MSFDALAAFAGVLVLQIATPGSANALIVARTLARGRGAGAVMAAGVYAGDLILLGLALAGLAAAEEGLRPYADALRWLGAGVLVALAIQAAAGAFFKPETPAILLPERGADAAAFAVGVVIPLTNPKAFFAYLAVVPTLFEVQTLSVSDKAVLVAVMTGLFTSVVGAHVWAADLARGWLASNGPRRALGLLNAAVMLGVAAVLLLR